MQFLKTLFWVILAVVLVLFARANWEPVTLNLWGGLQADIKKPILILAAFLLGLLPTLLIHRARTWSIRRQGDPGVEVPPAPAITPDRPLVEEQPGPVRTGL